MIRRVSRRVRGVVIDPQSQKEVTLEFKGNAVVEEFSSLLKGESPRCVAIVCAAFFDETLGVLLGDKQDRAFFDRIIDARDFGLLTSDEHDDLQVLRQLRNHFAHRLKARSFDSSKAKMVDSLKLWRTASSQIQKYKQLFPSPCLASLGTGKSRWLG
jgi:hypothetical protein